VGQSYTIEENMVRTFIIVALLGIVATTTPLAALAQSRAVPAAIPADQQPTPILKDGFL
jgi:hypothetical protein